MHFFKSIFKNDLVSLNIEKAKFIALNKNGDYTEA